MISCTSFTVERIGGQVKISYTYDQIDAETGEPLVKDQHQSMYVVDKKVAKSIDAILRFITENGSISEESLKPRRY